MYHWNNKENGPWFKSTCIHITLNLKPPTKEALSKLVNYVLENESNVMNPDEIMKPLLCPFVDLSVDSWIFKNLSEVHRN